jgi:AraC-like DNA-binding protein
MLLGGPEQLMRRGAEGRHLGKYPMKQSTGPTDVSIRACSTAPRGVAMAIRFMQRNLARPLTTGEIAAAAGTSERSLRRQFQRFTGQSPIAFHRHLRLEAARHALCDNHAKADITTAAGMHGFNHLSHFTGQYRRRYGELPSATLRALRESPLPLPSHAMCEPISLIVLPFICTDSEFSNAAFAETMTDRVISALTRTRWLNVLSPDSDLPAANNIRVAPACARYAVRGRVQCIGGRVQAVIRLIDVTTGCCTTAAAVSRHDRGHHRQCLTTNAGGAPRPAGRGAGIGGPASLTAVRIWPLWAVRGRGGIAWNRSVDSLLQQGECGSAC